MSATTKHVFPEHGIVLGLDVGWSDRRKTTGLCALAWTRDDVTWAVKNVTSDEDARRRELRALLGGRRDVVCAAVDGPLRPQLVVSYEHRACEAILSAGPLQKRGKPGSTSGGSGRRLHEEATLLARLALESCDVRACGASRRIHDTNLVEAFPNFFLGALHDTISYPVRPKKKRKWTDELFPRVSSRLAELVRALLPGRHVGGSIELRDHEHIAALACAVTALCFAAGEYTAVGSSDDGFIVLPPRDWLGEGWQSDLSANLARRRSRFVTAFVDHMPTSVPPVP